MRRLHIVIVTLAVCHAIFSGPSSAGPADQTVSGLMEKWSASFNKLDADALASLYSKNALFFGGTPPLYRDREGVTTYFSTLPRWKSPTVQFTDLAVNPIGADVINVAATAIFVFGEDTPAVPFRLTWVIIREDNDWKIVSHHASPRPTLK